jgi:hypothetical protein
MKRKEIEQKIIEKVKESEQFKKTLFENPKQVLKNEFGFEIPDSISLEVLEEKPDKLYLVLPITKKDIELPDDILDNVAGGCCGPCGYEEGEEPQKTSCS